MGRRWVIGLSVGFPAALAAAMVWYAWPRTGPSPHEGSLVSMHYVRLMWAATELLSLYWGATLLLLLRGAAGAPGSGARTAVLVSGALALVSIAGVLALWTSGSWITGWYLLVVACWSSAVLSACYRSLRAWGGRGVKAVFAVLVVALVALPAAPLLYWAGDPWIDTSQLRLPDGRIFHLQRNRRGDVFDSEETHLLTREVSKGKLFLKTEAIACAYGPFEPVFVIRPERPAYNLRPPRSTRPGRDKSGGRLVVGRDGMILFIYPYVDRFDKLSGCATNLAYEPGSGLFLSGDGLNVVSPFVLIGARDAPNRNDLAALLRHQGPLASAEVVVREAANPNSRVREAVAHMLASYHDPLETIGATLGRLAARDPDPGVRKAARASVAKLEASDPKEAP